MAQQLGLQRLLSLDVEMVGWFVQQVEVGIGPGAGSAASTAPFARRRGADGAVLHFDGQARAGQQ